MTTFTKRTAVPVPVEDLFAYHARVGAIDRLMPPWEGIEILQRGGITNGERVVLNMRIGMMRRKWIAEHYDYVANQEFSDRALRGPFKRWNHHHRFRADFQHTAILEDTIDYTLPAYAFFAAGKVRRDLERMFRFRHARTLADLQRQGAFRDLPRQTFAITGATGLVARTLAPFLTTAGHRVVPVTRPSRSAPGDAAQAISWNPATGELGNIPPGGIDTFIHLAGRHAADRWSPRVMKEIRESRVPATEKLCRTLAGLPAGQRPKLFIGASAIGLYGDRGDETLTEDSAPGTRGFFPEVCQAWEAAAAPARDAGIRVVHLRIGVVLSAAGGALAKLSTPTKLGLAGPLGTGGQWMPWIAMDDLVGLIHHLAMTAGVHDFSGPVNAVTAHPVRQRDFARTLANVLHRPAVVPMPAFAVRMLFGQMGQEVLLASTRVIPRRIPAGFQFLHPMLEPALRSELGL